MTSKRAGSGIAMLEALVALVVVSIGAVAVVGMQATMRQNSDVAKQRAEAVRLAGQLIEEWRGAQSLTALADIVDWTDIVSSTSTHAGVNATFTRTATVVEHGAADDEPLSKTIHVSVAWTDRAGQVQSVALNTMAAGVRPDLPGSLAFPADKSLLRNPGGRHRAIPRAALDQPGGVSHFTPPGSTGEYWVFNNTSGAIDNIVCPVFPPPTAPQCGQIAVLLSGYVRFATGAVQPTPALAENPVQGPIGMQVTVAQTSPSIQTVSCFVEYGTDFLAYYCAVPVVTGQKNWSGMTVLAGLTFATSTTDATSTSYRVCRYTDVRDNTKVVPTDLDNSDHPLNYVAADGPLTNQNFLVIRAGSGGVPFTCPNDDTTTLNVSGSTWNHQPASTP